MKINDFKIVVAAMILGIFCASLMAAPISKLSITSMGCKLTEKVKGIECNTPATVPDAPLPFMGEYQLQKPLIMNSTPCTMGTIYHIKVTANKNFPINWTSASKSVATVGVYSGSVGPIKNGQTLLANTTYNLLFVTAGCYSVSVDFGTPKN